MKNKHILIKIFKVEFKTVNIPPTMIVNKIKMAINFEKPDLPMVISRIAVNIINTKVKKINTFLRFIENSIMLYSCKTKKVIRIIKSILNNLFKNLTKIQPPKCKNFTN